MAVVPSWHGGLPLAAPAYTAAIRTLGRRLCWHEALQLLAFMPSARLQPHTIPRNSAVDACARSYRWQEALEICRGYSNLFLEQDIFAHTSALSSCGRSTCWWKAVQVLHTTRAAGLRPTAATIAALTAALDRGSEVEAETSCKKGASCWTRAQDVLRRAVEDRGEPGLESLNAAISGISRRSVWRESYSFLYLLRRQKILPDEVSHNAVAFGGHNWRLEHFLVLSSGAVRPNEVSLVTLMSGLSQEWSRALLLKSSFSTMGFTIGDAARNSLLLSISNGSNWSLALRLWSRYNFDAVGTSSAMSGFAQNSLWKAALTLLQATREMDREVDDFVLSSANSSLSFTGQWEFAFQLLLAPEFSFCQMRLDLEATACGAAFTAVQRGGNWVETLGLLTRLSQIWAKISVASFTAIADACSDRGKWLEALQTFEVLATSKGKMDTLCLGPLLSAVGGGRQWQMAPEILWKGRAANFVMNKILRRIALDVTGQDLQWKWALHLLEAPLGSNTETDSAARNAAATLLCSSSCWAVASNLLNEAGQWPKVMESQRPRLEGAEEATGTQQRIFQRDDIAACALLLTECEQNELALQEAC
ncbi:unnamed protein product [Cladocopium goreaui]|uniref:Pentatricopeptide repeat-containing protein At2g41720 (Protein EMBRYO DEFECTIVE 2654) n=1 Tax=Cladocopium goreaui TaxID=2562237 RepID=A0A9P1GMW0_9DINO|nr:unnamed protein product [Cladocopium goreaui]